MNDEKVETLSFGLRRFTYLTHLGLIFGRPNITDTGLEELAVAVSYLINL